MNNPYQAPAAKLKSDKKDNGCPRFAFQIDEYNVVGELQLVTGRERVYVNDDMLFSRYNMRLKGVHDLYLNEQSYQLVFTAESVFKPLRTCHLEKDGVVLKSYRSESKPKKIYMAFALIAIFIEVIVSTLLIEQFGFPEWWSWVSPLTTAGIVLAAIYYGQKHGDVVITEQSP